MTKIGDLIGEVGDALVQDSVDVGNVYLLALNEANGITPKNGDAVRFKFFIVLGFDADGNVIGGLVINSNINYKLPSTITDYQLRVTVAQCPFLQHHSFVNCSKLIVAKRDCLKRESYRGKISDPELMSLIVETLKESPTISQKQLERFGIV